ncbi:purine nucleoside permease [Cytidiella melzeri]|nr:purine nucleoside permease [Cytidiella melzeri]
MRTTLTLLSYWACVLFYAILSPVSVSGTAVSADHHNARRGPLIAPKVFIITMFENERDVWIGLPDFNILAHNVTVPGFSPLFPQAHCTVDNSICLLTTGEAEINAAVTMTSLTASALFDLKDTYFLIAGVAGISPKEATIGGVTFARFAVQVGLQNEIDAREIPSNFTTGYIPQGATAPNQFPTELYGTEVFELNDNLRQLVIGMTKTLKLYDDADAASYRANYATFENTTRLFTNGTGVYCTTQQEDNGTLEALLRAAVLGRVDFSRIILMRSGSDFDRQFPGQTAAENLFGGLSGFDASIKNLGIVGVPIVQGIVAGWDKTFGKGVKPSNYIGDIFGSLGGQPSFGPGSLFGGKVAPARRSLARRFAERRASTS